MSYFAAQMLKRSFSFINIILHDSLLAAHKCKWKPLSYNGQLSSVYGSIMEHMNALVKSTRLLYILKATEPIRLRMNKDILWWCKLHPLIVNRIQLEYIMACLSTLGGAHSSLGDFSQHHVRFMYFFILTLR